MRKEVFSSVADIVDKSVLLVDKAIKGKDIPEVLLPYLYLSFASFYIYYGKDAVNTIYSVYKDSNFSFSDEKSSVFSSFKFSLSDDFNDIDSSVDDDIFIFQTTDINLMFHDVVHEINHLVNSKRSRIVLTEDKTLSIRLGIFTHDIDSSRKENYYLNELINSYEAEEVEQVMVDFIYPYQDEIKNERVKSIIKKFDPKIIKHSYASLQKKAYFIFNNKEFYRDLKTQIFNGDIENIESNFNSCFGNGFYQSYSGTLAKTYSSKDISKKV